MRLIKRTKAVQIEEDQQDLEEVLEELARKYRERAQQLTRRDSAN